MTQSNFGAGLMFGLPPGGGTPRMFGALQNVSVDFDFDIKPLHGGFSFPLENARAKGSIEISSAMGRIDPDLFNALFFASNISTGDYPFSAGEAATVPGSSPYTVTVANSANFRTNLGVFNPETGLWLTQVASSPTTGQYSVANGVYTFAAADTNKAFKVYYTYGSSTTGKTITYTNPLMDAGPVFGLQILNSYRNKALNLYFHAVQGSSLSLPFKQDDFLLPEMDLVAQATDSGDVFTLSARG